MFRNLHMLLNSRTKQCLAASLKQISSEMAPKGRLARQETVDSQSATKAYG